jgi:hypothetical protein
VTLRKNKKRIKISMTSGVGSGANNIESTLFTTVEMFYRHCIPRNEVFFLILDCEAIGTAATPGLLCQPRVIMKMIVEK